VIAQLVYQVAPGRTRSHVLTGDDGIGRHPSLTVCIDRSGVSRRHARIQRHGSDWWIEDLRSTNGTFLNGQAITRERLRHLDVVTLGKAVELVFVLGLGVVAQRAVPPPRRAEAVRRSTTETRIELTPEELKELAELRETLAQALPPAAKSPTAQLSRPRGETPPRPAPPRPPSPALPARPLPPAPASAPRPLPIAALHLTAPGLAFALDRPGSYLIGRDPGATFHVNETSVSRRHARIVLAPDRLGAQLEDAGSTNGTEHNGRWLDKPAALADGDRIGVGRLVFEVRIVRG
jgi:pSer/pThr/pTyr-binding forkhead associated (FHA) protein